MPKSAPDEKTELADLIPVRSRIEEFFLKWFLLIIPGIYLFRSILEYIDLRVFPRTLQDYVKILTEITLIIALIFSNLFLSSIKPTILQLLTSNNISRKTVSKNDTDISAKTLLGLVDSSLNHNLRILFRLT